MIHFNIVTYFWANFVKQSEITKKALCVAILGIEKKLKICANGVCRRRSLEISCNSNVFSVELNGVILVTETSIMKC